MSANPIVYIVTLGELSEVPGTPFSYWAPKSLRDLFEKFPPLDRDVARRPDKPKMADVKVGLQTSDDLRFTRYWWEVPIEQVSTSREGTLRGRKWVPYFNRGGLEDFYMDVQHVINWANDGHEIRTSAKAVIRNESFYFRAGLAWALIAVDRRLHFRAVPNGTIIGVHGSSAFPRSREDRWPTMALGNSSLSAYLFFLLDPTLHARHVGYVSRLPANRAALDSQTLANVAHEGYNLVREWMSGDETATVFAVPWISQVWWRQHATTEAHLLPVTEHALARDFVWSEWDSAKRIRSLVPTEVANNGLSLNALAEVCVERERLLRERLGEIQRQIDDEVYQLYGISDEDRALVEAELGKSQEEEERREGVMPAQEHIKRLVHYLAHEVIKEDPDGIVPLHDIYKADGLLERGLAHRVREKLGERFGEAALPTADQELRSALGNPLGDWIEAEFFNYHVGLYRLRPIIWQVASCSRGKPAFACFVYWHKLDADTLRKVQEVYLRPVLDGAARKIGRLATQLIQQRAADALARELRQGEQEWGQAEERYEELRHLSERIQDLLQPHQLSVQSRSVWVPEKVNEIVAQGYRPNRDYGVRVNLEPLKQAEILSAATNRVKG